MAEKSQKQIAQLVSAERGELVTFGGIISASGNTIPLLVIFPRVHFKDQFMVGAPEGSFCECLPKNPPPPCIVGKQIRRFRRSCNTDNISFNDLVSSVEAFSDRLAPYSVPYHDSIPARSSYLTSESTMEHPLSMSELSLVLTD